MSGEARRRRPLGCKLVAAAFAALLAFAVAESAARIVRPSDPTKLASEEPDDRCEKRLTPDFTNVREKFGVRVHVNRAGFRDDEELPLEKAPGEKRVLFLGDSFVYAERVPLARTFMKLAVPPGARSLALCCPGWGTRHERFALEKWGLAAKPDLVVLCFFVGNDVLETYSTERSVVDADHAIRYEKREPSLRKQLLMQSRLWQLWEAWQFSRREAEREGPTFLAENAYYQIQHLRFEQWRRGAPERSPLAEAWTLVGEHLAALAASARGAGSKLLVLAIPDEMQVSPGERAELCRRFALDEKDYDLEQPQRALAALCEKNGLPLVDALPAMRGRSDLYFPKDTHWDEAGHALAAKLLAPEIERLLRE